MLDYKVRTLDDYMPQIICGTLEQGVHTVHDTNAWYLCDQKPGHDGDCSSPYKRYELAKPWRYVGNG